MLKQTNTNKYGKQQPNTTNEKQALDFGQALTQCNWG